MYEHYETDRRTARWSLALGWMSLALGAVELVAARRRGTNRTRLSIASAAVVGVAALDVLFARRLSSGTRQDEFGMEFGQEQAVTVRGTLEQVEAAWVDWCVSGHAQLKSNYAVRFEPAPGARGTEVYLAGGGSKGAIREELRHFKQLLETGEIPIAEGSGYVRAAQPAARAEDVRNTGVTR